MTDIKQMYADASAQVDLAEAVFAPLQASAKQTLINFVAAQAAKHVESCNPRSNSAYAVRESINKLGLGKPYFDPEEAYRVASNRGFTFPFGWSDDIKAAVQQASQAQSDLRRAEEWRDALSKLYVIAVPAERT